jgi:hypothetical protein
LNLSKLLRHALIIVPRVVDDDWYQERLIRSYQMGAVDRELPFEPKVALGSLMGSV